MVTNIKNLVQMFKGRIPAHWINSLLSVAILFPQRGGLVPTYPQKLAFLNHFICANKRPFPFIDTTRQTKNGCRYPTLVHAKSILCTLHVFHLSLRWRFCRHKIYDALCVQWMSVNNNRVRFIAVVLVNGKVWKSICLKIRC